MNILYEVGNSSTKLSAVIAGAWTFVGTTHCASQKFISLYHGAQYAQTTIKPKAYLGDGQVMTIASGMWAYTRIGDMLLSTNICMVASDFNNRQIGRTELASCLPGNNGFYDACGSFALLVRPAFSGEVDLASSVTFPVSFALSSAPTFYRTTLSGQNFYLSGWALASALSSTAINIFQMYRPSPNDVLTLLGSTTPGVVTLQQTWSFQTAGLVGGQSISCAIPTSGYVYFYMQVEQSGGNTIFTVCCQDHTSRSDYTEAATGLIAELGTATAIFAQIPIYNAVMVPYTVSPVLNAAFFAGLQSLFPLNAVDPNCTWGSGPVCLSCVQGYYVSINSCKRCHPNCSSCTGAGLGRCSACSSGFYAQPMHASICLPTCPTGYSVSGLTCAKNGSGGDVITVDFIEHTAKDFTVYGQRVVVKTAYISLGAYSLSDRGIFLDYMGAIMLENNTNTASGTLILNTDFSYDMWAFPYDIANMLYIQESLPIDPNTSTSKIIFDIGFYSNESPSFISVSMGNYRQISTEVESDMVAPSLKKQWVHLGVSVTYDPTTDLSTVVILQNKQLSSPLLFPSFLQDTVFSFHSVGMFKTKSIIAAFTIVNNPRTLADFIAQLGACPGCSVCPADRGICLLTCLPDEYIGPNLVCSKCSPECQSGCSTPTTCSASLDPICNDWNSVTATCTQCYSGAVKVNGRCECEHGKVSQGTECVASCSAGFYAYRGICSQCELGCNVCSKTSCLTCSPEFLLIDGQCSCGPGWYITSDISCAECETPCMECQGGSKKCTLCATDQGYFLFNTTCVDCRSVPGYNDGLGLLEADLTGLSVGERALKVCREVCGDGILMGQYACDDGNLVDGDGCSHLCQVETGWSCEQGKCLDVSKPLPVLRYLNLTNTGYLLLFGFNETVEPVDSLPALITVSIEYIDLFSFSLQPDELSSDLFSVFQLSLTLDQSVPSGTEITVSIPSSLADLSGNRLAASEATSTLLDPFISKGMKYLDLLMSGVVGILLGMMGTGIVVSLLMDTRLDRLWSLVEALQFTHMLLYSGALLPDNIKHYLRPFRFANFHIVPCVLCSNLWSDYDGSPYAFGREQVSVSFLMNIGPILTLWWACIVAYVCVLLATWAAPNSKLFLKLKESFRYRLFLRLAIETSLQTALAVCLQLSDPLPGHAPDPLNLVAMGVGAVLLAGIPLLVVLKVTLKPSSRLKPVEYSLRYGSLYAGYKLSRRWKRSFLLFRLLRKTSWAVVLVAFSGLPTVQAGLLTILSVLYLCALIVLRPFRERYLGTATNIAAVILLILSQSLLLGISLDGLSLSIRNYLGWATIGLLTLYLLVYLIAYSVDLMLQVLKGISRLYQQYALEVMESVKLKQQPAGELETTVIHTEIEEPQQQSEKVPRPLPRPRPLQRPKLKRVALMGRKK